MSHHSHHLHRRYMLPGHLRVVERGPDAVQIGIEAPSRVVLRGAPACAAQVLRNLTGHRPFGDVLTACVPAPVDFGVWVDLVGELATLGLIIDAAINPPVPDDPAGPDGPGRPLPESAELASLTARLGAVTARRVVRSRADARVHVVGPDPLTATIRTGLTAAGLPDVTVAPGAASGGRRGRPAATDLVVVGAVDVIDLGVAATLTRDRIPHLGVVAGTSRVVVGPLVLPGRSSCVSCAHRHRIDADPEWPIVLRSLLGRRPASPAAVTATMAGALATAQILDHLDGLHCPATIDGTLEWDIGAATPRRRSWVPHPECGCHTLVEQPPGAAPWPGDGRRSPGPAAPTVTMEQ